MVEPTPGQGVATPLQLREMKRLTDVVISAFATESGQTNEAIARALAERRELNAEMARAFCFIDLISS